MDQAKKGFLPILQGVKLSHTQCLTTAEDREKMKDVPYASAIGSIMYAMLCTRPEVCLAMSQSRGTRVIQEWTGQRSNLSLVTSGLRNFLDYGGGKRVRRKGVTPMQTLTLIRIILSSKPDSYSRAVIWNSSK